PFPQTAHYLNAPVTRLSSYSQGGGVFTLALLLPPAPSTTPRRGRGRDPSSRPCRHDELRCDGKKVALNQASVHRIECRVDAGRLEATAVASVAGDGADHAEQAPLHIRLGQDLEGNPGEPCAARYSVEPA